MFFIIDPMFGVLAFIFVFFIFIRTNRILDRLSHIEKYLQEHTKDLAKSSGATVTNETPTQTPEELSDITPLTENGLPKTVGLKQQYGNTAKSSEPGMMGRFSAWVKEDWMMKLGGLLLIFSISWFLQYAFAHNWIGEYGRIAIGFAIGASLLSFGRMRMNKYITQGGILMFVGAVVIVLTTFIAREIYDMFTPVSALAIIFITSSLLAVTSTVFNRSPLAYANVFIVAIAPLLTYTTVQPNILFTYLLVMSLGNIWVSIITGWRKIIFFSLLVVSFYSIGYVNTYGADLNTGLMFSFVFTAIFLLTSIFSMRTAQSGTLSKALKSSISISTITTVSDLLTAIGSGIFILLWILVGAAEEWQSLLLVAWTIIFAVGATLAVRLGAELEYFYGYAGVGVVLLGSATAIELSGPTLTIVAIIEALIILLAGYKITKKVSSIPILAIPSAVPLLLAFSSMNSYSWRDNILQEDSLVLLLTIISLISVATYFRKERLNKTDEKDRKKLVSYSNVAGVTSAFYGIVYIWLAMYALFGREFGVVVSMFIYAAIGSWLYIWGKQTGQKWKRVVGAILIIGSVFYILIIAGAILGSFGRIIAGVIVAVLLILTAWHEKSTFTKKDDQQ